MKPCAPTFAAGFNGSLIEVDCECAPLAEELRLRLFHLLVAAPATGPAILRLIVERIESDWIEIRDLTGRCERGQLEYVVHCARRWVIEAFVEAHPEFLWLHGAGAARDGSSVLLCGSPGAGKSTLAVRLIDLGWTFVADDIVPIDRGSGMALPLPFTPCIRTGPLDEGGDLTVFLEQSKRVVAVASDRVATAAQPIRAIVFPEFSPRIPSVLLPLSAVSAARSLIAQCVLFDGEKARTIADIFHLAEATPAFHVLYRDPVATAVELTTRWPELSSRLRSARSAQRPATNHKGGFRENSEGDFGPCLTASRHR